MHKIKAGFVVLLALFTVGMMSCKKKAVIDTTVYYWSHNFLAGNFTMNNQDIPIYNDASTTDETANFFKKSEAAAGDFQELSIQWYVPTDTTLYTMTIANPSAELLVSGVNIQVPATVSFQRNVVVDSLQYAIYKIEILPSTNTANKDNLENVKFGVVIDYIDGNGTITSRSLTSNIYKKDL